MFLVNKQGYKKSKVSGWKGLALFMALATVGMGPVVFVVMNGNVKVDPSQSMPHQVAIRGAYVNSQSVDVGPDRPLRDIGMKREQETK